MTQQERFNSIEDRWLEPPECDVLFMCDCCGNEIYEGERCCMTADGRVYCEECVSFGKARRNDLYEV